MRAASPSATVADPGAKWIRAESMRRRAASMAAGVVALT
jgi:hypothetical protein